MSFEVEGESPKALFRSISEIQNVFETDQQCGACESHNTQFRVRTVDDNDYYGIQCQDCLAELKYGQLKKGGGLFVKRKDAENNPLPNRGWEVWRSQSDNRPGGATPIRRNSGPN